MKILSPKEALSRAIAITAVAFDGKYDKGGVPYQMHCLHVMGKVGKKTEGDFEAMAIAVMHDLIEDIEAWTEARLEDEGFSDRVVEGVMAMTHEKDEPYMTYIGRISQNSDAVIVKMADLKHNSDPHRLKDVREKDFARIVKYHKAYQFLKGTLTIG